MSHYTGGATTVCPFYLRENDKTLTCEGCTWGSTTTMRFAKTQQKTAWQEEICARYHFRRCPLASATEMKYGQ